MAASSPLNFSSSLLPALLVILIIAVATQVEARPSPRRPDTKGLRNLFHLNTQAHPEVTEGSAEAPSLPQTRLIRDVMSRHRKLHGRSRKGAARGCFGMKVDRIGSISGLGC